MNQLGDPAARYNPGVDRKGPITLIYAVDADLRIFRPDWKEHPGGIDQALREHNVLNATSQGALDTVQVATDSLVARPRLHARLVVTGDVDFVNNANLGAWGCSRG